MENSLERADVPVALRTLEWGPGQGSRVLLVHGVQSAASTWWRIADALARGGAHVTAPDLRGHGVSPSAASYRIADFAADLHALGRDWELAVGHSLGGTVIAAALSSDAGFARRAVLLDPVLELPEGDFDGIVAGQLAELAAADPAAIQAANPGWHPEDCRLKALAAEACSPFVNEAVLRDNRPWDYADLLSTTDVPVLVLGGDLGVGGMLDPQLGTALARANAGTEYRVVHRAGHSLHRDRPELVVETLLGALPVADTA